MAHSGLGGGDKPVLFCDLDGIVADLMTKWLDAYNRDYKDQLTVEDVLHWEWHELVKPEVGKRIYHYLSRPGWFADLEPLPGAVDALRRLSGRVEIVIATASPKSALRDKTEWVHKHLPFIPPRNIVLTYRKDLLAGDFLFDDAPRNLRSFRGTRITIDYPYNRDFTDCYRVRDWEEFETLMDRLLEQRDSTGATSTGVTGGLPFTPPPLREEPQSLP